MISSISSRLSICSLVLGCIKITGEVLGYTLIPTTLVPNQYAYNRRPREIISRIHVIWHVSGALDSRHVVIG